MKFAAIAGWAASEEFPVSFMCTQLEVSRAGFYRWLRAVPSARSASDADLTVLIKRIHSELRGNPGVRRVRHELLARGYRPAHKRVHRLMRAAGLAGRHPRAWRRTTIGALRPVPAPDLIGRDFTAATPGTRWCGDITYIKTWDGWAFLATVIDLYSRAVVGWAIADHMRTDLVIDALTMAVQTRKPAPGVIFHSDRGCQYTSEQFAAFCAEHNIRRSLGRTGSCYDNAVSESFFATYKKELIHTRPWPTIKELAVHTREWIEDYFNTRRRHSTLGYLTTREYELGFRDINQLAA